MELRQLRYFLAVADARSFVSAANDLFVSRQAVSKAISQLESELNTELFFRNSGGAFLTPSGMVFYDRVRSNVIDLEKAQQEMVRNGARYMQNVHIAFSVGTLRLYEDTLIRFRNNQRNTSVRYSELTDENCIKQLVDHKAELAVCYSRPTEPVFVCEEILSSPYGVLMRQGGQEAGETVSAEDLKWLPLAGFADVQTQRLCSRNSLSLSFEGYDFYRLFELAAAGKCALLMPRALVPERLKDVVWSPLTDAEPWQLYRISLRSLESNILYRMVLDDLQTQVFGR